MQIHKHHIIMKGQSCDIVKIKVQDSLRKIALVGLYHLSQVFYNKNIFSVEKLHGIFRTI